MRWKSTLDRSSKTDAWLTYRNHFQGSKTQQAFFRGVTYHDMPIAELLKLPLENAGLHRLQRKHPFPIYDRPRGRKDLESLRFLMTTHEALSTIVLWNGIVLDGVHRIIAAAKTQSVIRVAVIPSTNQSPASFDPSARR